MPTWLKLSTKQACFGAYSTKLLVATAIREKSLYSPEAEDSFCLVSEAESVGAPVSEAVKIKVVRKPTP